MTAPLTPERLAPLRRAVANEIYGILTPSVAALLAERDRLAARVAELQGALAKHAVKTSRKDRWSAAETRCLECGAYHYAPEELGHAPGCLLAADAPARPSPGEAGDA